MADHTPRLLDALNAFEEGIYIINEDYTVEYMNKSMKTYFEEGKGKKCYEVISGINKPCDWCKYNEIFEKNETHHSRVFIESVGKTFALSEMPVTNTFSQ